MERKIKVVLLCHYWSDEMAEIVGRKHYFRELSPWIQETLNLFKEKKDVEFHVVAPNYAANKDVSAQRNNIHYHFFHYSPAWLSVLLSPLFKYVYKHDEPYKMAERLANMITGYSVPARNGAKTIRNINPDLIHLYGSEIPDHGYPAIQLIDDYPVLLSRQGSAYKQAVSKNLLERWFQWHNMRVERVINNKIKYVASSKQNTIDKLKQHEKGFFKECEKLYFIRAITKVPKVDAYLTEKKYDVVFYARISVNKGIRDLIEALAKLKERGRIVSAVIMGRGDENFIVGLKKVIKQKGMEEQINMIGFVDSHEEVYEIASKARMMVLPTHNDGIPNTVREAMFMRLPVVANNVGGIPRFNENRHCVHLVELGDIEGLAFGICKVLDDDNYREDLIKNAYKEAYEVYSPDTVYDQTITAYKDVYKYVKGVQ